jgi:hypothetical protein
LAADGEPRPEREQDAGGDELERPAAGEQLDADDGTGDHPRQGAGDQQPGQVVQQSSFVPEPQQPAGDAATLNSRLVGVTPGLGTCNTLSWTGSSSTAPDTPAGVVTRARRNAQSAPMGHCHGIAGQYPARITTAIVQHVSAESDPPPTIFDWGGGRDAFERWLNLFYDLVEQTTSSAPCSAEP